MKSLFLGVALLAMCAYSTEVEVGEVEVKIVHLEDCQRGHLTIGPASESKELRKKIKHELGFGLNSNDTIVHFNVRSDNKRVRVAFAGRNKGGKSIAMEFDPISNGPLEVIPFGKFFDHLECELDTSKPELPGEPR